MSIKKTKATVIDKNKLHKYKITNNYIILQILTFEPSSLQQQSKGGSLHVCIDFGTVLPLCSTSQHLTLLSQLPAIRKFWGIAAGEKAKQLTESSGGETTSKSFIGFDELLVVAPNALKLF